jgi:hypothetical protein
LVAGDPMIVPRLRLTHAGSRLASNIIFPWWTSSILFIFRRDDELSNNQYEIRQSVDRGKIHEAAFKTSPTILCQHIAATGLRSLTDPANGNVGVG